MNNNEFFNKLYAQICEPEINHENAKLCLISNELLNNSAITLECKHSFNYECLFNEVKQQKYKYVKTEIQRLRYDQIKCPYCRNVQTGLLPYYSDFDKVRNVNHPQKYQMKPNKCIYKFKSGKKKGLSCEKPCFKDYCISCEKKKHCKSLMKTNSVEKNNVNDGCIAIIKSGKRKGQQCGKKSRNENNLCGIHCKKH